MLKVVNWARERFFSDLHPPPSVKSLFGDSLKSFQAVTSPQKYLRSTDLMSVCTSDSCDGSESRIIPTEVSVQEQRKLVMHGVSGKSVMRD